MGALTLSLRIRRSQVRVLPSAPIIFLHMAGKRDPELKKNARGTYKTHVDREFCKGRGCKQKYHYRKKVG
jgi:hypothetical protein